MKTTLCVAALLLLPASCGGQTRVQNEPQPTARATSAPAPTAEPTAEALPDEPAAPSAKAPDKAPEPEKSNRPASIYGPQKKISSTFGSTPASILKLKTSAGEVSLTLPEGALSTGTNVTFEVGGARGVAGKVPKVGDAFHVTTQVGGETRMSFIDSAGPPFVVTVNSKKSVNLAVGAIELDASGLEAGKVKEWVVYPPTSFDEGLGQAKFELKRIGPSVMYATHAAPTAK